MPPHSRSRIDAVATAIPMMQADRETLVDIARARLVRAIEAVGRGDEEAMRTLYRLTSAKLFVICLRICGERAQAEDVLQSAYLKIW
ncbi:MAG: RNA polymerase subunit sigma, partial [Sphingopyxis terrae]